MFRLNLRDHRETNSTFCVMCLCVCVCLCVWKSPSTVIKVHWNNRKSAKRFKFITSNSGNTEWVILVVLLLKMGATWHFVFSVVSLTFNYALAKVYKNGRIWIIRMHILFHLRYSAWLMLFCCCVVLLWFCNTLIKSLYCSLLCFSEEAL